MQENLAPRRTYDRDSVEFARTVAFTDGLFAIAMTLLVVSLAVPTLTTLAACCWFLGIPFAAIAQRWKPEGADELLLG